MRLILILSIFVALGAGQALAADATSANSTSETVYFGGEHCPMIGMDAFADRMDELANAGKLSAQDVADLRLYARCFRETNEALTRHFSP